MKNFQEMMEMPFVDIIVQSEQAVTVAFEFRHWEYLVIATTHND